MVWRSPCTTRVSLHARVLPGNSYEAEDWIPRLHSGQPRTRKCLRGGMDCVKLSTVICLGFMSSARRDTYVLLFERAFCAEWSQITICHQLLNEPFPLLLVFSADSGRKTIPVEHVAQSDHRKKVQPEETGRTCGRHQVCTCSTRVFDRGICPEKFSLATKNLGV